MQKITLLFVFCLLANLSLAQSIPSFFKKIDEKDIPLREHAPRGHVPKQYQTWQLDLPALKAVLADAPMEFTPEARTHAAIITLPNAEGMLDEYAVWEIELLEPDMRAKFPNIRTYAGELLSDRSRKVRFSVTARGLRVMIIRPDMGVEYIKPHSYDQTEYYIAYDRVHTADDPLQGLAKGLDPKMIEEKTEPLFHPALDQTVVDRGKEVIPVNLRIYRFASSCTALFALDHGGTLEKTVAAVTEYTNEMNTMYERDVNIRIRLADNTDKVVNIDPLTDPFNSGTTVFEWMALNPALVNTRVGVNNYDVGHVFARYLGGDAIGVAGGLGIICANETKGRGCSAGNGQGDYGDFFVAVIGQEVGHQFGGGHTWNRCGGGGGRQGLTAFEPGSGTTIMSYAGACGSDNVPNNGKTDLYYHSGSIEEIQFYVFNAGGNLCGKNTDAGHARPEVTLPYKDGFYIPIRTPFVLNGSATDPDGDPLTYCWEQMDAGPEVPINAPAGDCAIFRSRPAVPETFRYFPRLSTVINNGFDVAEQLPTYDRKLTFRLTARDNRPNGGGVGWKDVAFRATEQAGPFLVKSPNTVSTIWRVGEYVTVQWDVANTDKSPVNCKKVDILLSTDAGKTFAIVLASNVDNDGSQSILVPNNVSTTARVMVRAADNVFYDVSNANFRIQLPAQPALSVGLSNDGGRICQPDNYTTDIFTVGTLGFNKALTLDIEGTLPPGATASFGKNNLNTGENTTLTVDMSQVKQGGLYTFNLRITPDGQTPITVPIDIRFVTTDFSALRLQSPADGAVNQGLFQTLRWNKAADAITYDVQIATNPAFTNSSIVASLSDVSVDTFRIPVFLEKNKAYYWRVRPQNECGVYAWTDPFFFSTFTESCRSFESNDLPKVITASSAVTIETKLNVPTGGSISDVNIKKLNGSHTSLNHLDVRLRSPQGTEVILFRKRCSNYSGEFKLNLDDNSPFAFSCASIKSGTPMRPEKPLAAFNGQNAVGNWVLVVKDTAVGQGGNLGEFELEFCAALTINAPYLVNNNPLSLPAGANGLINKDLLLVEDSDNTHSELIFTLVSAPRHGQLRLNGVVLVPGSNYTQADIDAGKLSYQHDGNILVNDDFRFSVTDGKGGFFGTPKFIIKNTSVSVFELPNTSLQFNLYPNPATEQVWLELDEPASSDVQVQLLNAAGQLMGNGQVSKGMDRFNMNISGVPQGVYFVRLEGVDSVGVKRLMITK